MVKQRAYARFFTLRAMSVGVATLIIFLVFGTRYYKIGLPTDALMGRATSTNSQNAAPASAPTPSALGQITVLSGPTSCGTNQCYELQVSCSQVSRPEELSLKIGVPTGSTSERGVVLFFTGWIGDYWWADEEELPAAQQTAQPKHSSNVDIVTELRANGLRTVEVKWARGWFITEIGQQEDFGHAACKPATVARWVYDHLRVDADQAFCATGHSNGAAELAYLLTWYRMADLFSLVLFEGGPNWARIDHSCIADPAHPDLFAATDERQTIDWGFGYNNDGSGICAQQSSSDIQRFQDASLADHPGFFYYPNTMVSFLIGENDTTTTARQGEYFYNWLVTAGTPLLTYEIVPGADHFTTEVAAGAELLKNKLLNECYVR